MARNPRSQVPKTSGQGTARLAYQKGRALGNRGGAAPASEAAVSSTSKAMIKPSPGTKAKLPTQELNLSVGDTLPIRELRSLGDKRERDPMKQLKRTRAKKLK